jgi:site-specific recombinase XerD
MRTLTFNCCLAEEIQQFINLRQAGGFDYKAQAVLLSYFDIFLVEQSFAMPPLDRQIIEQYEKTLSHLKPRSRSNRMCVVRQLCAYISHSVPQTFIPDELTLHSSDIYKPEIFSEDEICSLINAAAKLPPKDSLRGETYKTLFGVLYSTGIRIGEALALDLGNFYSSDGRLFVAQGKFRKSRWLPLHDSTTEAILHYVQQRKKIEPCTQESPLFLNLRGQRVKHCAVSCCFHQLLSLCGIAHEGGNSLRIHDIRHSFAVNRLLDWYQQGEDINSKLAWLATYMGHVDIRYTHRYLQPTAELLEQVSGRFHDHFVQHVKI